MTLQNLTIINDVILFPYYLTGNANFIIAFFLILFIFYFISAESIKNVMDRKRSAMFVCSCMVGNTDVTTLNVSSV